VKGDLKNLIFAADGPKPKIVFRDAINNDIDIVENEQYCLVYDRPLGPTGLTWRELTAWWAERRGMTGAAEKEISRSLYHRLDRSLGDNDAERRILRIYGDRYVQHGPNIPALIPQVYLHYDPYTKRQGAAALTRQRMDFLLLLPNRARVVIECDGVQHYANDNGSASPRRYAEMVAEDRELRLRGYEVYRFGGQELQEQAHVNRLLSSFFDSLAERHAGAA
jgi:very-short-patch-repair endonuclease